MSRSKAIPTRERLLDAALTLFAEKGYVATGTQEIIDAAGVSKWMKLTSWPRRRRASVVVRP